MLLPQAQCSLHPLHVLLFGMIAAKGDLSLSPVLKDRLTFTGCSAALCSTSCCSEGSRGFEPPAYARAMWRA
jgi:hypothetical protein